MRLDLKGTHIGDIYSTTWREGHPNHHAGESALGPEVKSGQLSLFADKHRLLYAAPFARRVNGKRVAPAIKLRRY